MNKIASAAKIKIFILGVFISLLVILMIWAFLARVINDLIVDLLEGNTVLLLIMLGLFGITLGASVIVGIWLTEDLSKTAVLKASLVAFLATFIAILAISYFALAIFHPVVYEELHGLDIVFAFPSVIMYFSVFLLNSTFGVYILTIVLYYLFFIIFLESFHEYEVKNKHYDNVMEEFLNRRF